MDDAWINELMERLRESDVDVREGDAPAVHVTITRLAGKGLTPAGIEYRSVRFDAEVRILRARVTFRGTPVTSASDGAELVADDRAADDLAARDDLIARIVAALAY